MIVFPSLAQIEVINKPHPQIIINNSELIYNVKIPPQLQESQYLSDIVNKLVQLSFNKRLSKKLSITLIDLKTKEIAGYQQDVLRYPASVVKLFWMVVLYAAIDNGRLIDEPVLSRELYQMIQDSSNDSSSRIIDKITYTHSGENLGNSILKIWLNKRQKLTIFFENAGYNDINISHKTYPISYLNERFPQGRDLQIRGVVTKTNRNALTTYHASRLMYEIFTDQAISPEYSRKIANLLTRNLKPEAWQNTSNSGVFNPIKGFLGEGLAKEKVQFASKAGWTTSSRQEVAYVATPDGKTRYILAIFGDDPAYGKSRTIFPEMSKFVFDRMTDSNR